MKIIEQLKNQVIVSVQAMPSEPLYKEECMKAMMLSVVNGGAKILRVAGERDVKIAKSLDGLLAIGITKPKILPENWIDSIYITIYLYDDFYIYLWHGRRIFYFQLRRYLRVCCRQSHYAFYPNNGLLWLYVGHGWLGANSQNAR